MDGLKKIFNNSSVQKGLFVANIAMGIAAIFAGAGLIASTGHGYFVGSVIGGSVCIVNGLNGLQKLSDRNPPKL